MVHATSDNATQRRRQLTRLNCASVGERIVPQLRLPPLHVLLP